MVADIELSHIDRSVLIGPICGTRYILYFKLLVYVLFTIIIVL